MNRSNFYDKVTVDGNIELDFLHNPLSDFPMIYEPQYYRITNSDLMHDKL